MPVDTRRRFSSYGKEPPLPSLRVLKLTSSAVVDNTGARGRLGSGGAGGCALVQARAYRSVRFDRLVKDHSSDVRVVSIISLLFECWRGWDDERQVPSVSGQAQVEKSCGWPSKRGNFYAPLVYGTGRGTEVESPAIASPPATALTSKGTKHPPGVARTSRSRGRPRVSVLKLTVHAMPEHRSAR